MLWVKANDLWDKNLFNKLNNLVLSGVAGQELVDVRHQVDADRASKSIAVLQDWDHFQDYLLNSSKPWV